MRIKNKFARMLLAVMMLGVPAGGVVAVTSTSAQAAACYGASCTGRNPQGTCNGSDAKTVGAMNVNLAGQNQGMLELRWSPSCVANWGRFTPYWRWESGLAESEIAIFARVTVWNPGAPSQGTAYNARYFVGESTYSFMTDGRPRACTGVEVFHLHNAGNPSGAPGDMESLGWFWGPCY